jgi:endonuclease YncB( thermonuclease family)
MFGWLRGFRVQAGEISVRDGDSIWWRRGGWGADGQQTDGARKFRLAGYDAPEIGERAKSPREAEWGEDAKGFLQPRIGEARKLRIKPTGQTRFEATELAVLYIDGRDARDVMIDAGMGAAVEWRGEYMVRPKWDELWEELRQGR